MDRRWRVAAVAGVALLLGALFALDVPFVIIATGGLAAGYYSLQRAERAYSLLLFLGLGISNYWVATFRPSLRFMAFPLNALDFSLLLLTLALLPSLLRPRSELKLPRHLQRPLFAFTVMAIFGTVYGVAANAGSAQTLFRDARMIWALYASIFTVAWTVRSPSHLRNLALVILFAAIICALQQYMRLVVAPPEDNSGLRDVQLPMQVVPMAIIFLMIYRYHRRPLCPNALYPLALFFLLTALLVSLTRSDWGMMALAYVLALQYLGRGNRGRALLAAGVTLGLLLFVIPFLLDLSTHGFSIQAMIQERGQQILGNNDTARQARLFTYADAWLDFMRSPVWGHGFGHPIYVYDSRMKMVAEDPMLHNSFLFWACKIGVLGMLAFTWLFVNAMRATGRIAKIGVHHQGAVVPETVVFAQALYAAMVPFLLLGPWSGNQNYYNFMPVLGLIIAIPWGRLNARIEEAPPSASLTTASETPASPALTSPA